MAAANKAAPIPVTPSSLKKFTLQHSLSFKLLLDFMNSNTYSGNYGNKKNAPLLKNKTKIYGKVLGASAIL